MRRAFTLLELLVALAVIGLLISLVVVSWAGVRSSAGKTESLNALRNMTRAYLTYATDHNQKLLPGFLEETDFIFGGGTHEFPKLPNGHAINECMSQVCDASSYPWRLAPWMDNAWESYYQDYGNHKSLVSQLTREVGLSDADGIYGPASATPFGSDGNVTADDEMGVATVPAYGLNSIFLGGDAYHGTAAGAPDDIAAKSMSEVLNPGRVTVFGAATRAEATLSINDAVSNNVWMKDHAPGSTELRAPFLEFDPITGTKNLEQWLIDPEGMVQEATLGVYSNGGGWPVGRWSPDDIPLSRLDGSVKIVNRYELWSDFRFWSPKATGIR